MLNNPGKTTTIRNFITFKEQNETLNHLLISVNAIANPWAQPDIGIEYRDEKYQVSRREVSSIKTKSS